MSEKPVVFLDFDGVLNTWAWRTKASEAIAKRIGTNVVLALGPDNGMPHEVSAMLLDPEAVKRVNRIVFATGARVVASTTWRRLLKTPRISLTEILQHAGATFRIADVTPMKLSSASCREQEIRWWLESNGHPPHVALDDIPLPGIRSILTYDSEGLTDAHAEVAIDMLRGTQPTATPPDDGAC